MADTPKTPASPPSGHRQSSGAARGSARGVTDMDHGGDRRRGCWRSSLLVGPIRSRPVRRPAHRPAAQDPNADRVRTTRSACVRWRHRRSAKPKPRRARRLRSEGFQDPPRSARHRDPLKADRKRREYESLFASNVVLSRRPERRAPGRGSRCCSDRARRDGAGTTMPSIDEIADAAIRATARASRGTTPPFTGPPAPSAVGTACTRDARARSARPSEPRPSIPPGPCIACSRERSSTRS